MNDYITKPIIADQLTACLNRWLDKKILPVAARLSTAQKAPKPAPPPQQRSDSASLPVFIQHDALHQCSNDPTLLQRLLLQFQQQHGDDGKRLVELIDQQRYDDALLLSHALKGVAQTLVLPELAACARALESALRAGDYVAGKPLTIYLRYALSRAVQETARYRPAGGSDEVRTAPTFRRSEVRQQLERLISLLKAGDIESQELAARIVASLADSELGEPAREMIYQIQSFDFEPALVKAHQLIERLPRRTGEAAALSGPAQ